MYRDEYYLVLNFKKLKHLIRKLMHVNKVPPFKFKSEKYENYTDDVS